MHCQSAVVGCVNMLHGMHIGFLGSSTSATKLHLPLQAAGGQVLQDTVLQYALRKGSVAMVQLLLSHGADVHASHFMVRYNSDLSA